MEKGTFNHSVKVPKLYKCAAKISQGVAGGAGSIKQLVYEKTHFNTKALYALVVTTFQKANELDFLLKRTKLLEKETRLDPWLAKILISELLWGKKQLPNSDAKPILTILAYEQAFRAHLSDSSRDNDTVKSQVHKKPRYIRINTLITPLNEALELFQEEGWTLLSSNKCKTYEEFLEQVVALEGDCFLRDFHVSDLLIFPHGTEFYNHPGYKKGAIQLQDKASCLPIHILSPPLGSIVLDMCAAPGMKTTQLAALLEDNGTVYAVERDSKRCEVLKRMVENSGATCVKIINEDVLRCSDHDFPKVEYILVDPSCSGSGMTNRLEVNYDQDVTRLPNLAGFQIKILRSALTRYPDVKKVVYSTCSIYPEENEDVVRQVLETNNNFKLVPAGNLLNGEWINFGSSDFGNIGKYCLYARPEKDLTHGFFLAVFERLGEGENNEFYNGRLFSYRTDIDKKQARMNRKYKEADLTTLENIKQTVGNNMETVHSSSNAVKKKKHKRENYYKNNDQEETNAIICNNYCENLVEMGLRENDTSLNLNKKKKRKISQSNTEVEFQEKDTSTDLTKKRKRTKIKRPDTLAVLEDDVKLLDGTKAISNEGAKRKQNKLKHKTKID